MRKYKPLFRLTKIPEVLFLPTQAKLKEGETFVFYQDKDKFTAIARKIRLIEVLPEYKKSSIVQKQNDLLGGEYHLKTKIDLRSLHCGVDDPYKALADKYGYYRRVLIVALEMISHTWK